MANRFLWMQSTELVSASEIRSILDRAQLAGIDALLPYSSRRNGLICHSSQFKTEHSYDIDGQLPVEFLADKAHARGMKVQAWLAFGRPDWRLWQTWLGDVDPEWIFDGGWAGYDWLDFSNPDVQDVIASICHDILEQSPYLDGISTDYTRWVDGYHNYNPAFSSVAIAQTMRGIRAAIPSDKSLTLSCVPIYDREGSVGWKHDMMGCGQPWVYLLAADIIDHALIMTYYRGDEYNKRLTDYDFLRPPGVVTAITPFGWDDDHPAVDIGTWRYMLASLAAHRGGSFVIFDGKRMTPEYWAAVAETDWEPVGEAVPVEIVGGQLDVRIVS